MQIVIDIPEKLVCDGFERLFTEDEKNTLIKAIGNGKALKQEPCDDAVRRQAVLDINEHHHGQMPNHVNHEIWKEIMALPSVTPQQ